MTTPTSKAPRTAASRRRTPPRVRTTSPQEASTPPASDGVPAIVLAAVAGAHGVNGEVKLKLFTDDLSPFRSFNDGALKLTSLRGNIARFAEVTDRNGAEALRGTTLRVPRADLPPLGEGEYYHADLIGLAVVTDAGGAVGRIVAVENFGAGDLIEVARPDGSLLMIPFDDRAVPEWDAARVVVETAFTV